MDDFWENNEIEQYYKEFTEFLHEGMTYGADVSPVIDPAPVSSQTSTATNRDGLEYRMKILAGILGHPIVFTCL
jgi:hypothetical protein